LAVAEGIELALTGRGLNCQLQLQLKWPNDVMLEGKKVSGVLVEKRQRAGKHVLVLGLGVNVNTHPADTDVSAPATSLAEHLGEQLDRIPIVRAILRRLDVWVMEFVREPQTASDRLQKLWNRRCGMINQRHTVISRGRRHTGRVIAIDPLEGLTLLTDSNLSVRVHAQETTIL